jgi:hypothetical protein
VIRRKRTRRHVALTLGLACFAAVAIEATAAKVDLRAKAQPRMAVAAAASSGRFAVAFGVGSVARPRRLRLRIESKPEQWITAVWVVTCHRGLALESNSASASGRSPLVRELPLPLHGSERCSIFAGGQLEGTGAIAVKITRARKGE